MHREPRTSPSLVEIEISNFCNLKCTICRRGNPDYIQEPIRHMSFDEFKKIIDSYDYPIERFQFCGTSEPTTNPDLVDMVKYVVDKKKPKVVELITNGRAYIRFYNGYRLHSGIDYHTPVEYERMAA